MALINDIINGHTVEYDDTEFEICHCLNYEYLHYIGEGNDVHNPKGNTSCVLMFQDYKGTNLNLSNFNTQDVTDMSEMFENCDNLKQLNLSNFNTSNVISMECMFYNCKNLKLLDISKLNTESVINMEGMFGKCENLKELDISSFYIDNTKKIDDIFWNCKGLEKLKVCSDYLQFFSINRISLETGNRVNIISISKLDRIINDLFY